MDGDDGWLERFSEDGYAVLENFLSHDECDELRTACSKIVSDLDIETEHRTIFSTVDEQQMRNDEYFLDSGDKIRYFFEKGAFNDTGELQVPKEECLNKIGHALHWWNPVFKRISFSSKMKDLAKKLDLVNPAVIQSMYIFKNPRIGGEVIPHQDASFLHQTPIRLHGVWIALEDATEENGCLWFIPGSHKQGTLMNDRRMIRTTDENGKVGNKMTFIGTLPAPDHSLYTCVPVKKGSMVLIHGLVMHKSALNTSDKSRHAYTLHLMEQHETEWSELNWLQPTKALPFTPLYPN